MSFRAYLPLLLLPLLLSFGCADSITPSTSDTNDLFETDTGPICPATQSLCGEECVDLKRTVDHCGACDQRCAPGELCVEGSCALSCPEGLSICEGTCVNLMTDEDACGDCETTCGEGERCMEGSCQLSCPAGQVRCGERCVDPLTDLAYCGAGEDCEAEPGVACPAGTVCDGTGSCTLSCQEDLTNCDGACVDLWLDNNHCGDCGEICDPGLLCSNGNCQQICLRGQIHCDTSCVDPMTDRHHCGANLPCESNPGVECAEGEVCMDGVCEPNCFENQSVCEGACIDSSINRDHCGSCGNQCPVGEICIGGACELSCPIGQISCEGICINPTSDNDHCGAGVDCEAEPGVACGPGELCDGTGICAPNCSPGLTACEGGCVNLLTDEANCGWCGSTCAPGEACDGGSCALNCPTGQVDCEGFCIDPLSDLDHCGAGEDCASNPGVACDSGTICDGAGACAPSCLSGLSRCTDTCVDLLNDESHCGTCGLTCDPGHLCDGGICTLSCPTGQVACDGACIDPKTDQAHCGAGLDCATDPGIPCAAGTRCDGTGSCATSCAAGTFDCGGVCVNRQSDESNCGTCGTTCGAGEHCDSGLCAPSCQVGFTDCGGVCVDMSSDEANCGNCGTTCGAGQRCESSACVLSCPVGEIACGASCVDPQSDEDHCGAGPDCQATPGTSCGAGSTCVAGVCESAGSCSSIVEVFHDDFSDNSAGWTMGSTWGIGSATASSGHDYGNPDPSTDFTPSSDNGVAGVSIGGNYPGVLQSEAYLTSPVIDLSSAAVASLRYERWLNCDSDGWTPHKVEVYDGSSWQPLWESSLSVRDNEWSSHSFDLTPYLNADLQIRFGYAVIRTDILWVMSGWNLDDITITACQ